VFFLCFNQGIEQIGKGGRKQGRMAAFVPRVGETVFLLRERDQVARATVRYFGNVNFNPGAWVGLEMHDTPGKNDGSVNGISYFNCKPGAGLFVRNGKHIMSEKQAKELNLIHIMEDEHEEHKDNEGGADELWFGMNSRAFIFNKSSQQWLELGSGETKVYLVGDMKKIGLHLVDGASGSNCLDHLVEPSLKIEEAVIRQQSWVFRARRRIDPSVNDVLCLQFATVALANAFVNVYETKRKSLGITDKSINKSQTKRKQNAGGTRQMRRRLTMAGSNPNMDGLRNAESPRGLRSGEVGAWQSNGVSGEALVKIRAYSGISRKGLAPYNPDKPNQDAIVIHELPMNGFCNGELLLCVFDGHGENGHHVSNYFANRLGELLSSSAKFAVDEHTCEVLSDALLSIENELVQDRSIDTTLSGTTAVVTVLRGDTLFVANVGDSRVIKGTHTTEQMVPIELSIDHKPDSPEEKERIERLGGRVFAMKYDDGVDGPPRVWLSYADMPGLAMSRSMCDTIAKEAGVISNAETFKHKIQTGKDQYILLATDGLWEFMPNEDINEIVLKYMDTADTNSAISELLRESNKRWQAEEPVVDDTTIILAYL